MGLQEEFLRRGRFAPRHRLRRWLLVLHCAADCPWKRRYARNCPRPLRINSIGIRVRPRGQFAAVCHLAIVSAASLRFRRQHPRLVNLVETERARRHWRHSAVLKSAGQSPIGRLPLFHARLLSSHSSQLKLGCRSRPPCHGIPPRIFAWSIGTKHGTTQKTFRPPKVCSFVFAPGKKRNWFCGFDPLETDVEATNSSL